MDANSQRMISLLNKQYLQLLDVDLLQLPPLETIIKSDVQEMIYFTLFDPSNISHSRPPYYQIRVLKRLISHIETAFTDSDEDEISDSLMSALSGLLTTQQPSALEAAQRKSYVTYSLPDDRIPTNTVTTLESRGLLSSSGTTGFRTWEAALRLGSYLQTDQGRTHVRHKNVLELGAGTGFVSLLCSKHLEASLVLATDGDVSVVEDVRTNIFLNEANDDSNGTSVNRMEASVYKWGHALLSDSLSFHDEPVDFDIVLGADITYDLGSIPALVATFRELFQKYPNIEILVAATLRNEETFEHFRQACMKQKFVTHEIEFECPPIESQTGFFHSTSTPIVIICLKAPH